MASWADLWLKEKALKHVVFKMQLDKNRHQQKEEEMSKPSDFSLLSDTLALQILIKLPQQNPNSLVCKKWMCLLGQLVTSIKLLDWNFLESGRLVSRFPNLTHIDLASACIDSTKNSPILLTHRLISIHLDSEFIVGNKFVCDDNLLSLEKIDRGLRVLARGCPSLRKLVLISASEDGLSCVAEECPTLQELELHDCTDFALKGIVECKNLQILKLVGCVDGFYGSVISDIGLTILANGCKRLVKIELSGCEGSYDGIRAIGQCCDMLEEITFFDHRMDAGWIAALSFCGNLKTLRLISCKKVDPSPGPIEHLGSCPTLETLHLQRCQIRDKESANALFLVCIAVRDVVIQDCWGMHNEMFAFASICRRVKFLSLEGCSLLTTDCLESVVLSWVELQQLKVVSCNNIKDSEVTPAMSTLFSALKELKWRPDTRSLLSSDLAGTGIGKKGGRFFKKTNLLHTEQLKAPFLQMQMPLPDLID
ncbi:hypothetical protein IFM89_027525, partial [Coptis chinensis]